MSQPIAVHRVALLTLTASMAGACSERDETYLYPVSNPAADAQSNVQTVRLNLHGPQAAAAESEPSHHERRRRRRRRHHGGDRRGSDCQVEFAYPDERAEGVPITARLGLRFSCEVDPDAAARAIELVDVDSGRSLPFSLAAAGAGSWELVPETALQFFSRYELRVAAFDGRHGGYCSSFTRRFSTVEPLHRPSPLGASPVAHLVRLGEVVLTTSGSLRGVQIHRADEAQGAELVGELDLDHPTLGLESLGDRAYVAAGDAGVAILDTSSPERPVLLGNASLPSGVVAVAPFQQGTRQLLAAAMGPQGVAVVDVSDAERAVTLAVHVPVDDDGVAAGNAVDVHVQEDRLAVADAALGTYLLDVAVPAAPWVVGASSLLRPRQVAVEGDHVLALMSGFARMRVFDANDPQRLLGSWNGCSTCRGVFTASFDLHADSAYVALRQGGVQRLSVLPDGSLVEEPEVLHADLPVFAVHAAADRVLAGHDEGLSTFLTGSTDALVSPGPVRGDARAGLVRGDFAYVAGNLSGLHVYDVSDPETPRPLTRVETPGRTLSHDLAAASLHLVGDALLLGDGRAGLSTFDLSDPALPELTASFTEGFDTLDAIQSHDGAAYACNGNLSLEVFDVAQPLSPVRLAPLPLVEDRVTLCLSLLALPDAELLYLGESGGLVLHDLADALAPARLGHVELPRSEAVRAMARVADRLYVSTFGAADGGALRLQWFDISEPRQPRWLGQTEPLEAAGALTVVGDQLLVAAGSLVQVYDVSAEQPTLLGEVPTLSPVRAFFAGSEAMYLAESARGLSVLQTGPLP